MTQEEVLVLCNKYYFYHRSNVPYIKKFKVISKVKVVGNKTVTGYGAYFNLNKNTYSHKGEYLYSAALTVNNPYVTFDQVYSAIITKEKKDWLYKNGFDSVALIRNNELVEVVVFKNSQIELEEFFGGIKN